MSGADVVTVIQGDQGTAARTAISDGFLPDPDEVNLPVVAASAAEQLPELDDEGNPAKRYQLPPDFPENAKPVGDGSYMLHLDFPVTLRFKDSAGTVKEEVYRDIHLRRLTGKMQKEIQSAKPEDTRAQMLASSAGISLGRAMLLLDRMDASEIAAMQVVIRFFMTPGRKIGPSSSPQ